MIRILEVAPATTHALRRAVLRDGRADANVVFEGDDERETFHLAMVDDVVDDADGADGGEPLAVVTFLDRECPVRPGTFPARQLRGMAVATDRQGDGLGAAVLAAGLERCRSEGAALVWAHARVTAIGFYERNGMPAESDVYIYGDVHLPHRTVVTDLTP